jgi:hypothetical protein
MQLTPQPLQNTVTPAYGQQLHYFAKFDMLPFKQINGISSTDSYENSDGRHQTSSLCNHHEKTHWSWDED